MENGGDPNWLWSMPFSRAYALYFMEPEENELTNAAPDDIIAIRNRMREKRGLPPLKTKGQ